MVMMRSGQVEVNDVGKSELKSGCRLKWYSSSPRAWSVMNLRVKLLVGEVNNKPLSHAGDGAAEATWPRHDVDVESCQAMPRWLARDAMSLLSHANAVLPERLGRGVIVLPRHCWPWHDVTTSHAADATCGWVVDSSKHSTLMPMEPSRADDVSATMKSEQHCLVGRVYKIDRICQNSPKFGGIGPVQD
jgi:hypothetical protein